MPQNDIICSVMFAAGEQIWRLAVRGCVCLSRVVSPSPVLARGNRLFPRTVVSTCSIGGGLDCGAVRLSACGIGAAWLTEPSSR